MNKNKHNSLLIGMMLFSPIVASTLSISCWKINYEKDIKISFKRDKNEILASEILKYLEATSTSLKVRYDLSIVKADDTKGIVELMITPIYKGKVEKRFNLTFDGFKKNKMTPLEEILHKIQNVDLSEKQTKTIEEYVDSFKGSDLANKITINGKKMQEFLTRHKIVSTPKLETKNKELGIAVLKIKFELNNEVKEIAYEISGFKKIYAHITPSPYVADTLLDKAINELGTVDLVDKEKHTISQYQKQFGNNLKEKLKFHKIGKDLKKYLEENKDIEIYNVKLQITSAAKGTGTVKFILKNKSNNKLREVDGNVSGFKEDQIAKALDEVLINVSLEGTENLDPVEYKAHHNDLKSRIIAKNFDNAKLVNDLKTKKIEIKDVKIQVKNYTTGIYSISVAIKNLENNEEITTNYESSNKFKSISIQDIVNKNGNIEFNDKNQTVQGFVDKYKDSQLKAFIKNFDEYNKKFKDYGIELRKDKLVVLEKDDTKIKLTIEYISDKFTSTSFMKEFEIGGFHSKQQTNELNKKAKELAEKNQLLYPLKDNNEYSEEIIKLKNWTNEKNIYSGKIISDSNNNFQIIKRIRRIFHLNVID
ncbi:lipoprotein 17-related variable surface protein [Metamycoplasma hyosynoviae]|uniref:lipoprotein 17-related variable surface protein n=1 Tax=Metamycoplasma hyosynoviae TaxID=29559 RepID=UPI0023661AAD|nr:lipoprotein 17-related variable surface protein [Metamycoplasma hyosynoviae]MDD7847696.1 lipoprotein 17-related variable surface protein [Metamycoplasma hyosynoviae]